MIGLLSLGIEIRLLNFKSLTSKFSFSVVIALLSFGKFSATSSNLFARFVLISVFTTYSDWISSILSPLDLFNSVLGNMFLSGINGVILFEMRLLFDLFVISVISLLLSFVLFLGILGFCFSFFCVMFDLFCVFSGMLSLEETDDTLSMIVEPFLI